MYMHRQTDRETERQTDRQTETDRERQRDRQTDRQTDTHTHTSKSHTTCGAQLSWLCAVGYPWLLLSWLPQSCPTGTLLPGWGTFPGRTSHKTGELNLSPPPWARPRIGLWTGPVIGVGYLPLWIDKAWPSRRTTYTVGNYTFLAIAPS